MRHILTATALATLIMGSYAVPQESYAAGPSSDFGRAACAYLKNKAMTAKNKDRKAKLWAEYRRCLKEKGEG